MALVSLEPWKNTFRLLLRLQRYLHPPPSHPHHGSSHSSTQQTPAFAPCEVRQLLFNLGHPKDDQLRREVISGKLDARTVASFDKDQLASASVRKRREELQRRYFASLDAKVEAGRGESLESAVSTLLHAVPRLTCGAPLYCTS